MPLLTPEISVIEQRAAAAQQAGTPKVPSLSRPMAAAAAHVGVARAPLLPSKAHVALHAAKKAATPKPVHLRSAISVATPRESADAPALAPHVRRL